MCHCAQIKHQNIPKMNWWLNVFFLPGIIFFVLIENPYKINFSLHSWRHPIFSCNVMNTCLKYKQYDDFFSIMHKVLYCLQSSTDVYIFIIFLFDTVRNEGARCLFHLSMLPIKSVLFRNIYLVARESALQMAQIQKITRELNTVVVE